MVPVSVAVAVAVAVSPAAAQIPGAAPPGAMLPFPPVGLADAPPLPVDGEHPRLGPVPAPAVSRPLAQTLIEAAPPARAPIRGISDGRALLFDRSLAVSAATIKRARISGAGIVRIPMSWRAAERLGQPADASDPADPAYDFAPWDDLVRRVAQAGLEPLITVYGAPDRAEASPRWPFAAPGTWAPDPRELGRFAVALARRYSGSYPDPLDLRRRLARVRWWQAWNEPNLGRFLQPQWVVRGGRWHAYAPLRYRAMLNSFWDGVKSIDPRAKVLTAGTAPIGEPRDGEGRMAPVRFWQAVLCLGTAPRIRVERCPDPAHFDLLAHHPLSIGDPTTPSLGPLDVGIADLDRIGRLLRSAQRHGLVRPQDGQSLAITELNWDSRPPNPRGVPARLITRYVSTALFLLWHQRVRLVLWQIVRDPQPAPAGRLHPAGLYRIDPSKPLDPNRDRPKPALRAFRMPFVAWRRSARRVEAWGVVPHAGMRHAVIQRREGGKWRAIARITVDGSGMASAVLAIRGRTVLRLADHNGASAAWPVSARVSSVPAPSSPTAG
jgi:hypothetical protein